MVEVGRILVLGGGIGGLSTAIALRSVGFHAQVFEQSSELREAGAGVALWSNAMASLGQLGVSIRGSRPLRTVTGANARGKELSLIRLDALGPEFASAACFVVLRPLLLTALAQRLPKHSDAILQNDLVDRPPAGKYACGRVVLIGDAAHPTTPNLGQGANMAIDDAIVLARSLRAEATVSGALERYERERVPRTRQIVRRSWSFGQMCLWKSPPAVWLREVMLRSTPRSMMRGLLRSQILENVGEL